MFFFQNGLKPQSVGLAPQTKLQAPQIEIWNSLNRGVLVNFGMSSLSCTNVKRPYWRPSGDGSH